MKNEDIFQSKRKLSEAEIESRRRRNEIIELVKNNPSQYSAEELAKMFIVSVSLVKLIASKEKLKLKTFVKAKERREKVIEMAKKDGGKYTVAQISDLVGITAVRVSQILKEEGLNVARDKRRYEIAIQRKEMIKVLAKKGYFKKDIAKELGISPSRVSQIMREEGIKIVGLPKKKDDSNDKQEDKMTIDKSEEKMQEQLKRPVQQEKEKMQEQLSSPVQQEEKKRVIIPERPVEKRADAIKASRRISELDSTTTPEIDYAKRVRTLTRLSNRLLEEELSDAELLKIRKQLRKMNVRTDVLVGRAGQTVNLSLKQAITVTENATRMGVNLTETVNKIILAYLTKRKISEAKAYLMMYKDNLELEQKNELIRDIRKKEEEMEYER